MTINTSPRKNNKVWMQSITITTVSLGNHAEGNTKLQAFHIEVHHQYGWKKLNILYKLHSYYLLQHNGQSGIISDESWLTC